MTIETDKLTLAFLEKHPANAARVLDNLHIEDTVGLIESTPVRLIAQVLKNMTPHNAALCLARLQGEKQSLIVQEMGVSASLGILRHLSLAQRDPLLDLLPTNFSVRVRLQLKYPQGSIGSSMNTNVFVAYHDQSVDNVLDMIRRNKECNDTVVYVVDSLQRLMGFVDVTTLFRSPRQTKVRQIMTKAVYSVPVRAGLDTALNHPGWDNYRSLPVLDRENKVVGSLSYDTLLNRPVPSDQSETQPLHFMFSDIVNLYWRGWISVLNTFFEKRI